MLIEKEIQPRSPFDFARSMRFLSGFPATQNEQIIEQNRMIKGVRISGATAVVDLKSIGSIDKPHLLMKIYADQDLSANQVDRIEKRVRFSLSIDEDLTEFYALAQQDLPFQKTIMPVLYGYRQVKFPSPFENAAWAVLAQRQPMAQSRHMKQMLVNRFSQPTEYEGHLMEAFPQPDDFFPLDQQELTNVIGHERKADYLIGVIDAFASIKETFLLNAPYDQVKDWLLAIKGIGEWSATFVLTRGLGRMEQALLANPEDRFNKNILRAATPVYGDISFEELSRIAGQYKSWQGYWAHFLKAYTEVM